MTPARLPSIDALDLTAARPRGAETLTLYLRNARPSFTASRGADRATIAVPKGSELLSVRGEPLLFVPAGDRTRHAWTAWDVWLAARLDDRGFALRTRQSQGQAEHNGRQQARAAIAAAEKARLARKQANDKARRDRERLTIIRLMKRQGCTIREISAVVSLSPNRVSQIWRHDQLRQFATTV